MCIRDRWKVIDALFDAGWARGADLSSPEHLARALEAAGLHTEILDAAATPKAKAALKDNTSQAIQAGVFGVPSFLVDGELFWGNDRFAHLEAYLAGEDPIDAHRIAAQLQRPSDHRRKAPS